VDPLQDRDAVETSLRLVTTEATRYLADIGLLAELNLVGDRFPEGVEH
jgi:hypothetical protein